MNCYLCDKPSIGSTVVGKKEVDYCTKHQIEIMVASDAVEEDPKALEKLKNKYKGKKKC
jgi:hypothetical protein